MTTKSELRNKFSLLRNNISLKDLKRAEENLFTIIRENENIFRNKKIACYWSIKKELPTLSLIMYLAEIGSDIFLPTIQKNTKILIFNRFEDKNTMVRNKYGIHEQIDTATLDCHDLDLILIPCVCFDSNGFRIGMGQGYFDHTLENCSLNKPKKIILAHEFQKTQDCFPNEYDIRSDAAITDKNFYEFD